MHFATECRSRGVWNPTRFGTGRGSPLREDRPFLARVSPPSCQLAVSRSPVPIPAIPTSIRLQSGQRSLAATHIERGSDLGSFGATLSGRTQSLDARHLQTTDLDRAPKWCPWTTTQSEDSLVGIDTPLVGLHPLPTPARYSTTPDREVEQTARRRAEVRRDQCWFPH
jgi:hypothetical protein